MDLNLLYRLNQTGSPAVLWFKLITRIFNLLFKNQNLMTSVEIDCWLFVFVMTFVIILCHLILLSLPCCSLGLPHPLAEQLKAMSKLKPVIIKLPVSQLLQGFKPVISGSWGNLDYHLPHLCQMEWKWPISFFTISNILAFKCHHLQSFMGVVG